MKLWVVSPRLSDIADSPIPKNDATSTTAVATPDSEMTPEYVKGCIGDSVQEESTVRAVRHSLSRSIELERYFTNVPAR